MRAARQIPWLRIIAEGVVIVVSILLAFGVDAWWDGFQERRREQQYLRALRGEFIAATDADRIPRESLMHGVEALIGQIQGNDPAPPDSLLFWTSTLSYHTEFDPPRAVFDDLASSGGTQLIRSDSLRLAMAGYATLLEQVKYADAQAWSTWEERIQPFLEGLVPRVERVRKGIFQPDPDELPFGPSPHEAQWAAVLAAPAFEDMLAERWLRLRISSMRLEAVLDQIDIIIGLIDSELS